MRDDGVPRALWCIAHHTEVEVDQVARGGGQQVACGWGGARRTDRSGASAWAGGLPWESWNSRNTASPGGPGRQSVWSAGCLNTSESTRRGQRGRVRVGFQMGRRSRAGPGTGPGKQGVAKCCLGVRSPTWLHLGCGESIIPPPSHPPGCGSAWKNPCSSSWRSVHSMPTSTKSVTSSPAAVMAAAQHKQHTGHDEWGAPTDSYRAWPDSMPFPARK